MADKVLKNFRSLECDFCQQHFGYQARTTRYRAEAVFCSSICAQNHLNDRTNENGPTELEPRPVLTPRTSKLTPPMSFNFAASAQARSQPNSAVGSVPLRRPEKRGSAPIIEKRFSRHEDEIAAISILNHFNGDGFRNPSTDTICPTSLKSGKSDNDKENTIEQSTSNSSRGARLMPMFADTGKEPASAERSGRNCDPFTITDEQDEQERMNKEADVANLADFRGEDVEDDHPAAAVKASPPCALPLRPPIEEPKFTVPPAMPQKIPKAKPAAVPLVPLLPRGPPPTQTQGVTVKSEDCVDRVARNYVKPPTQQEQVEKREQPRQPPKSEESLAKKNASFASAVPTISDKPTIYPSKRLTRLSQELKWGPPLVIGIPMMVCRVHSNSPIDIYIQTAEQTARGHNMTTELFNLVTANQLRLLTTFDVGTVCVAPYMGDYYRADIVKNDPGKDCVVIVLF